MKNSVHHHHERVKTIVTVGCVVSIVMSRLPGCEPVALIMTLATNLIWIWD